MTTLSLTASARSKASRRWVLNPADEYAIRAGYWFDEAAAAHAAEFFPRFLRHSKGEWAGKPFDLLDWQRDKLIYPLFGWMRPDGTRRFRKGYVEIPKKNGKSTIGAGISLYLLVADGEPGAEIYSAAADKDQAGIVYGEAANMVEASPKLSALLIIRRSVKRILYEKTRSFYRVLSSEAATAEGKNIHGLIFDELHAQRTRALWDALTYGGRSRKQPLLIAITTAGSDTDGICYEQHDYAKAVLDPNTRDPDTDFFAFIAAAEREEDWTSPEVWKKANPSFGITIKADAFAGECREAQRELRKQNAFRRYSLNQWTEQETRWIDMALWNECDGKIDLKGLEGQSCIAGLDLSVSRDLTALVLVFKQKDRFIWLPYFWATRERAEEYEQKHNLKWKIWGAAGLIELQDSATIDYRAIREKIDGDLGKKYRILEIAFDPFNAHQLIRELGEECGFEMVQFRQGYLSMSPPCKGFEEALRAKKIVHGDHPVLRWMAGNVAISQDDRGNIAPVKPKQDSPKKIDGIVAGVMAMGQWTQSPAAKEDEGFTCFVV